MILRALTTGLLIGIVLLAGCSTTNQDTTVTSTSESKVTEPNEFDSVSFPQESCGDKLPNDPKAYPVKYYPVFIDYNEGNLQSVKSKYCGDAFKKFRKTIGKDAIQVSSFLSSERANKFQKFMIDKIGSGEVGEPTVIEAKRTDEAIDAKAEFNLSVAKAAKLTPEQVKQLVTKDQNNSKLLDFKIIVPTYIPNGFQVNEFKVKDVTYQGGIGEPDYTGHEYRIVYRNLSNYCFSIESQFGGFGDSPGEGRTVEVTSPALGKVFLAYTEFSQISKKPNIAFNGGVIRLGKQGYSFDSPATYPQRCNTIRLQEAIKIVESLQYLNR